MEAHYKQLIGHVAYYVARAGVSYLLNKLRNKDKVKISVGVSTVRVRVGLMSKLGCGAA